MKKKIFSREEAAPARTIFFVLKLRDKKKRVVREPQPLSVFLIRSDWNSIQHHFDKMTMRINVWGGNINSRGMLYEVIQYVSEK